MKKILVLLALVLASFGAKAQSSLGVEIGTISGLSFTQKLGGRFAYDLRAGFELARVFKASEGMILMANIEPRYNLSSQSASTYYQSGTYLGLNIYASLPQVKLWGPKGSDAYLYTNEHLVFGFIPTFGWVVPVNERSYIRASAGAGLSWQKYKRLDGRAYWHNSFKDNSLTVSLQLAYSYRF